MHTVRSTLPFLRYEIMKRLIKTVSLGLLFVAGLGVASAANAQKQLTTDYLLQESRVSAQDDAALKQIIARLNHAIDHGDYQIYSAYFADEGIFSTAFGQAKGPEQVVAALEQSRPYISGKRHVASNIVISGGEKRVKVTSYLTVYEATTSLAYLGSAVNVDTLEKRNGTWKIVHHTTFMDPATLKAMQN
jgi:ketosteroid isomerase-like protein